MKRIHFISALIIMCFYSCQTVNMISIDYLVPADVSFPAQIKKVGIVNNVSEAPGRIKANAELDSLLLVNSNGFLERYTLNGDPKVAAEALAESVAAENYFDQVVICDSALQVTGTQKQEPMLSKEAVAELAEGLDVDMLISLEEIPIKVNRQVIAMGEMGFLGTVDVKVHPRVYLYIPNRNSPLVMINGNDSIFWQDMEGSKTDARTKVTPDEQIIAEASDFAGTLPVKHMTPHWKTADRFFYTSGSPEMRDAAYFVQSDNWDSALPLWEKAFENQKGKKKAHAASNIALYYEIKDDLDKADEWSSKALDIAKVAENIPDNITPKQMTQLNDYVRIYYNRMDLQKRKEEFMKLKMQMGRFNDDF